MGQSAITLRGKPRTMNSREPLFRITSSGLFTFSALVFVVLLLWIAAAYPPRARQVPEIVGFFGLICLAVQLILDSSPRLTALYRKVEKQGLFDVDEQVHEARSGNGTEFRLEIISYCWLAFFLTALLVLGFLIAIPLYILLYLRFQAKISWLRSAVYAAGTWLFVYFLFVRLFEIRLYAGMILERFFEF